MERETPQRRQTPVHPLERPPVQGAGLYGEVALLPRPRAVQIPAEPRTFV